MTSGFYKSALSVFLTGFTAVQAQTPTATPAGAPPENPKQGYFRFWNMMPDATGSLSLMQDNGATDAVPLLVAAPANFFASYLPMKPGRYRLKVVRSGDLKTVLKTFDVILKKQVYVTFLARPAEGKMEIEMVDDTYDPEKALTGKLVVRQFAPNMTVALSNPALPAVPPLDYGEMRVLENLPLKSVIVHMRATLASGKTVSWSSELNFAGCRHATLLLIQDAHGRFRPRMCADGQAEIVYSEKQLP